MTALFSALVMVNYIDADRGIANGGELIALYLFLFLSATVIPVMASWMRMVDAGYSKWLSLLMPVPLVCLVPMIIGIFFPSKTER